MKGASTKYTVISNPTHKMSLAVHALTSSFFFGSDMGFLKSGESPKGEYVKLLRCCWSTACWAADAFGSVSATKTTSVCSFNSFTNRTKAGRKDILPNTGIHISTPTSAFLSPALQSSFLQHSEEKKQTTFSSFIRISNHIQ